MAPRPNWKGYLKLSLVSCPIALYPATSATERVSFRQVNKQTGNRLRQQLVDSVTGEPVNSENKGRGYEIGKDQFLMVEDEELEAIRRERPDEGVQEQLQESLEPGEDEAEVVADRGEDDIGRVA